MGVAQVSIFKVGDKVRILPSAVFIGVRKSEVGRIVEIRRIISPNSIMISNSSGDRYACWRVSDYNIAFYIKVGQQLLFDFMG